LKNPTFVVPQWISSARNAPTGSLATAIESEDPTPAARNGHNLGSTLRPKLKPRTTR